MSPTRIGSIGLSVLMIRAVLNCSPTCVSSMFPFGFSVGMPGDLASKIVIFICGRAPMRRVRLTRTSLRLVIDVGDVAVGPVEDGLLVRSSLSRSSRRIVVSVSRWRLKSSSCCLSFLVRFSDFGVSLVARRLKLVDLRQEGRSLVLVLLLFAQSVGLAVGGGLGLNVDLLSWRRSWPTRGSASRSRS